MESIRYPRSYIYRRIVQAKLFIDANYAHKINLANVAGEAAFSKYHFIRLFKQIYGMPPHQYLMTRRIEAAKELLKSDQHSILEVCCEIGFESVTSFNGLFKKITGLSPSSFRSKYRIQRIQNQEQPLKQVPHCFAVSNGWV